MTLDVLVDGKDARTMAMLAACAASGSKPRLFAVSDFAIPGLRAMCERVLIHAADDIDEIEKFAREIQPGLALIGPEEPLGAGLVDRLEALLIPCFGPPAELAQIETSKSWTRLLLDRNSIPGNPRYRVFDRAEGLDPYLEELGDFVIKPDGLTGGKGVKVFGEHLTSVGEAHRYVADLLEEKPGRVVVVEERLDGEEFSLQTITDGETAVHCPLVQDHKRAEEGDTGPNTGGMGSYSCPDFSLPFLEPGDVAQAQQINERVIDALNRETGRPYRGVLYGGFMATADGVRLIEYNARFGDPEALNVLAILQSDFIEIALAVANGDLGKVEVAFEHKATVCKYVVPTKYPYAKSHGDEISVPKEILDRRDIRCYWAATNEVDSKVLLTGSRAVAFVGIGDTLLDAERRAEEGAASVVGPVRHRSDIGRRELIDERVRHMDRLRSRKQP